MSSKFNSYEIWRLQTHYLLQIPPPYLLRVVKKKLMTFHFYFKFIEMFKEMSVFCQQDSKTVIEWQNSWLPMEKGEKIKQASKKNSVKRNASYKNDSTKWSHTLIRMKSLCYVSILSCWRKGEERLKLSFHHFLA